MPKSPPARVRIVIVSLLGACVGCTAAPTFEEAGPEEDPAKEIVRLEQQLRTEQGEKRYLTRVKIEELRAAAEEGRWPSIHAYNDIVFRFDPDRPEAVVSYARMLSAAQAYHGRWRTDQHGATTCQRWLTRLIEKDPSRGEYYLLRARMARIAMFRTNPAADLDRAEKLLPSDPQVKLERAEWAVLDRQPSLALRRIRDAQVANPGSPEVHYLLGAVHQMSGNGDEALRQYDLALSVNPRHVDAFAARTLILWSRSDKSSGQNINDLREMAPGHPSITFYQGVGLWNRRQFSMAMRYVESASRMDPSNGVYSGTLRQMRESYNAKITKAVEDFMALVVTTTAAGIAVDRALGGGGGGGRGTAPLGSRSSPWQPGQNDDGLMLMEIDRQERAQAEARARRRADYERARMAEEQRRRQLQDAQRQRRGY